LADGGAPCLTGGAEKIGGGATGAGASTCEGEIQVLDIQASGCSGLKVQGHTRGHLPGACRWREGEILDSNGWRIDRKATIGCWGVVGAIYVHSLADEPAAGSSDLIEEGCGDLISRVAPEIHGAARLKLRAAAERYLALCAKGNGAIVCCDPHSIADRGGGHHSTGIGTTGT